MTGMAASTNSDSRSLVTTIMVAAPPNRTRLRRATESAVPTAALICVVSAVRREISSPLLATSKYAGDNETRCPNTSSRRSATMRSPSLVTKKNRAALAAASTAATAIITAK